MMGAFNLAEVSEVSKNIFEKCALGKLAFSKNFDKPMAEYDKPLAKECSLLETIKCRNEDLAGKLHPETNVLFERKIIEDDDRLVEVVVPNFDSVFDVHLSDGIRMASDKEQFAECNQKLKNSLQENSKLKENFDDEQLEQIENGDTPDGYTWHHDAEIGKMQLVDTEIHQKTGHTGGRVIWGGGNDNR